MNGKNKLRYVYATVIFGIIVAAVVLFFILLHNREEEQREINKAEADGYMQRLQNVDWENIQPQTADDIDWSQPLGILLLAKIPEADITMYGYNDEEYQSNGVAIFMGDMPYYFDWHYTSPRFIMPESYWNQPDRQLQVALHNFTGTGLSAEELHVLQQKEDGKLEDFCFGYDEYVCLLRARLDFSYDEETFQFTLFDRQEEKELYTADLSWLAEDAWLEENRKPEESLVENFSVGDIASFILGDEICLRVTPGYMVRGWVGPQYDEMPELIVEICLEESEGQIRFSLGNIQDIIFNQ